VSLIKTLPREVGGNGGGGDEGGGGGGKEGMRGNIYYCSPTVSLTRRG